MLFFKSQEKTLNYAKHLHKTFFDANLQKTYLNSLSTSPQFHLEDAVNHSNYIKGSDSHIQISSLPIRGDRSLNNVTLCKWTGSGKQKKFFWGSGEEVGGIYFLTNRGASWKKKHGWQSSHSLKMSSFAKSMM